MAEIITLSVGDLDTNCYIVFDPNTLQGFVVDPADEALKILSAIKENNINITHILMTHGHFDHMLALSELKEKTGAKVYIHSLDAQKLKSKVDSLFFHMYSGEFPSVDADFLLNGGETLSIGKMNVSVIHTPGHTAGSVCYDVDGLLISGDTLFCNSCGRFDFPDSNQRQLFNSLRTLYELEGDRTVYSGHGESTDLSTERIFNPYLRQAMSI